MPLLIVALLAFVGSHFVLSHPLRAPLVKALGAGGFAGVCSLVATATLGWAVFEWRRAAVEPGWTAPIGGIVPFAVATVALPYAGGPNLWGMA